jgi:hypothetical protein
LLKIRSGVDGILIAQACSGIEMKPSDFDPNSDRNWAWPEKTWFRERLNALRAREHEAHRKPANNHKEVRALETKPNGDPGTEKT